MDRKIILRVFFFLLNNSRDFAFVTNTSEGQWEVVGRWLLLSVGSPAAKA